MDWTSLLRPPTITLSNRKQELSSQLCLRLPLCKHHLIPTRPHVLKTNLHHIPIPQPPLRLHTHAHPPRRPRKNHISRQQRRTLSQKRNGLRDIENHVIRDGVLHRLAVDLGGDLEVLWVGD